MLIYVLQSRKNLDDSHSRSKYAIIIYTHTQKHEMLKKSAKYTHTFFPFFKMHKMLKLKPHKKKSREQILPFEKSNIGLNNLLSYF